MTVHRQYGWERQDDVVRRGTAAARPVAADVPVGTLYFSTDTEVIERSDGTTWESYSGAGGSGITQLTGDVTAGPGSGSQAATLAASGVSAATYGDATHVAQVAVDAKGRVTSATNVPITSGVGDVVGPASSVASEAALFDGTTGKLLKRATGTGVVHRTGGVDSVANVDLAAEVTGDLPFANLVQASAASKLVGRGSASGAGDFQEITIGSNLSMSGTTISATGGGSSVLPGTAHGRLTLVSGTAVPTTDQSGKTTVYWTPYKGSHIALYTSSVWTDYSFTEKSVALGTLTSGQNYDVFAYDVAGVVTLILGPAWSTDTSRGTGAGTTELTTQDGVSVNAVSISGGPAAKAGLYLGTFRATATTTTEDSAAKRFLWNTYNRVARQAEGPADTTNTWVYSTATWRQADNLATNQFEVVHGLAEDPIQAQVVASFVSSASGVTGSSGIGLDSTSALASGCLTSRGGAGSAQSYTGASWTGYPGLGYHFIAWLEIGNGSSTLTWNGDANVPGVIQSGIVGIVWT